jgi:VWFA-related protein
MLIRRAVASLCAIGLLAGQDPPKQEQKENDSVIREVFKFVLVPVTVTDRSGNFVSGLTPYDFRLFDNSKPQKITEDIASHPISLVIAIQANAVMEKVLPQIQRVGSVIESNVLGENGEAAVLGFDHRIQPLTGFTSEPDKIEAALKKLKPGSWSSNLNDAAMEGINLLRNRPANRRRILLLISEARDKGSEIKVRDVLTAADFANVAVYSVNVSHLLTSLETKAQPARPNPIPPEARHLPAGVIGTPTTDSQTATGNWIPLLKDIFDAAKGIFVADPLDVYTRYTGGREYSFMTQKTLERAISDIGEELHSQYMLTYLPNNQNEAGFHEIAVQVLRPDVKIRTRDGYWLAGKPE